MIIPNAVEKKRMTLPITNRLAAVTVNLNRRIFYSFMVDNVIWCDVIWLLFYTSGTGAC